MYLVKHLFTGQRFALKSIRLIGGEEDKEVLNINVQKDIISTISHPFLIKTYAMLQNETRLQFLMEFAQGSDLGMHIYKNKRFSEPQV